MQWKESLELSLTILAFQFHFGKEKGMDNITAQQHGNGFCGDGYECDGWQEVSVI
jgi:hypothetical protein